jgi:hypothetical protein
MGWIGLRRRVRIEAKVLMRRLRPYDDYCRVSGYRDRVGEVGEMYGFLVVIFQS